MKLPRALLITVCAGGMATVAALFAYVAVQQNYRQSANDPQLSMAQNAWVKLAHGSTPQEVTGSPDQVELPANLDPFIVVFDKDHNVVSTNSHFVNDNSKFNLAPPAGSFDAANSKLNLFTWENNFGDRYAAVLMRAHENPTYYVLTARSLFYVEQREQMLTTYFLITLGGIAAGSLALFLALVLGKPRSRKG